MPEGQRAALYAGWQEALGAGGYWAAIVKHSGDYQLVAQPRTVADIIEPQQVLEGAGVLLKRSIATRRLDYVDPFLLFDHFGSDNPKDYLAGFPMHPHRGIETVTYMLAGQVAHKDTLGNAGTIGAGDVQWMNSGGGIMHEEMPKPVDGKIGGLEPGSTCRPGSRWASPAIRRSRRA